MDGILVSYDMSDENATVRQKILNKLANERSPLTRFDGYWFMKPHARRYNYYHTLLHT